MFSRSFVSSFSLLAFGAVLTTACGAPPDASSSEKADGEHADPEMAVVKPILPKLCTSDLQCGGSVPYCCTAEAVCVSSLTSACYRVPPPPPPCPAGGGPTSGLTATQRSTDLAESEIAFFSALQQDNDSTGGIQYEDGIVFTPAQFACINQNVVEFTNPYFGGAELGTNGWGVGIQGYFTGAGAQTYPQAPAGSTMYLDVAVWKEDGSGNWTTYESEYAYSGKNWDVVGGGLASEVKAVWVQASAYWIASGSTTKQYVPIGISMGAFLTDD